MVRYAKKNQNDDVEDPKFHRIQRKYRVHKLATALSVDKIERRHGWGDSKRRTIMND